MGRPTMIGTIFLAGMLLATGVHAQGGYASSQFAALRGAKVRLHTYRGTVQGIVQGVRDHEVLLQRSSWQTDELPVDGILRVDVYSRDRGATITGMTLGGGLGLGVGLGIASWLDSIDEESGPGQSGMALMGSLGALVGATLGGHLMGAVWTPMSPRTPYMSLDPSRDGLTLSCAWSF